MEILALTKAIQKDKVKLAKSMTPAQKFLAGAELFEYAASITKAGIKNQHPTFTENQINDELLRRINLAAALERKRA